ncbi:unnamed protein product [Brachionus calyciflorus]|uniref:Ubiquitin-like protease family profile domain-containing protein n=1 Tax=Brachionus calyciflorus TaxID=104777 RepID=A0A813Q534_9BILA|nr:unnamed protein product [Brachionus calyciflorus]
MSSPTSQTTPLTNESLPSTSQSPPSCIKTNAKKSKNSNSTPPEKKPKVHSNDNILFMYSGLFLTENQWLTSSHIDFALECFDKLFTHIFMEFVFIDPTIDQIFVVNVENRHRILLTNIDPSVQEQNYNSIESYEEMSTISRKWFIYDSLNDQKNSFATKPVLKFLYPEREFHHVSMVEVIPQVDSNDCGLFTIAYAYVLSRRNDPSNLRYDQSSMRKKFNDLIKFNYLYEFDFSEVSKSRNVFPLIL